MNGVVKTGKVSVKVKQEYHFIVGRSSASVRSNLPSSRVIQRGGSINIQNTSSILEPRGGQPYGFSWQNGRLVSGISGCFDPHDSRAIELITIPVIVGLTTVPPQSISLGLWRGNVSVTAMVRFRLTATVRMTVTVRLMIAAAAVSYNQMVTRRARYSYDRIPD